PPPTPDLYSLSLHDALPICDDRRHAVGHRLNYGLRQSIAPQRRQHGGLARRDQRRRVAPEADLADAPRRRMLRDLPVELRAVHVDRKSTRLNSSHVKISYAV